MNQNYILFALLMLLSTAGSSQTFVEIDRLDWSNAANGDVMGTTTGGAFWDASAGANPANNCDGTGSWGVQNGAFVIEDWEGTCGCPCVAGEATPGCGQNDNTFFMPAVQVAGYCKVRVQFTVTASGGVACGSMDDQDPADFEAGCLTNDVGPQWAGTDGMVIALSANGTGDTEQIKICGDQGTGPFFAELDVEAFDAVLVFITAGTQQDGERYEIGDIVFEGVDREVNFLSTSCITCDNNTICENSGLPIILQTIANAGTSTFEWEFPGGATSTDASPEISGYTTASSGTYSVTVTEEGTCIITDQIELTIISALDSVCIPQAVFTNLFVEQCSNVTLPDEDENGEPGTWSPSADLSLFPDTTLTFTFTPTNATLASADIEIEVFDINSLENFGLQPANIPTFCNGVSDVVDFIELFGFNLDISLQINGDADLLPFISNGDFVNDFVPQFRSVSLLGLQPGIREFFIEGISTCGTETIDFRIEILGPAPPITIDTSLCFGDTMIVEGVKLYGGIPDTILINGGACDTLLTASVALSAPGVMAVTDFYPEPAGNISGIIGGGAEVDCGDVAYLYDTIISGQRGVLVTGAIGDDPPLGPNFDTVFTTDVTEYTIPFLRAGNGCDTIVNLNLTIDVPVESEQRIALCEGETRAVNVDGVDYIMDTRDTTFRRVEFAGSCTFVDIIVDVLPVFRDTVTSANTRIFRVGQDTTILGVLFNEANPSDTIIIPMGSSVDCPSFTYVDLTFASAQTGIVNERICPGDGVPVGDTIFTEDVTNFNYTLNTPASNGGDSIVNVTVEVLLPTQQPVVGTICPEGDFEFRGEIFDINRTSGFVNLRSQTLACDSIIFNVNISFFNVDDSIIDTSFCEGTFLDFAEFPGVRIDESNLTAQATDTTADGCIRQVFITGTVLGNVTSNIPMTICEGESVVFGGLTLTTSGQSADIISGGAANGCDSTAILDLTVLDAPFTELDRSSCAGLGFAFGNEFFSTAGTYLDTLTASNGCDSIVQLNLTIEDELTRDTTAAACAGDAVDFRGVLYSRDTILIFNDITIAGCSEELTVRIDILDPLITRINETARCADGTSVTVGSNTYNTTGIFRDTFPSAIGCDSIVITDLMVPDTIITRRDTMLCAGDFFTLNGQLVDDQGINDVRFFASNGCDSIVRFNLNLIAPFRDTIDLILCPDDDFRRFNDVLSNPVDTANRFITQIFQSRPQDGCDTTFIVNATLVGTGQPTINGAICAGDSLVLGNRVFRSSIRELVLYIDDFGCNQQTRVDLNVFDDSPVDLGEQVLCDGDGFMVGDSLYTDIGPHEARLAYNIPFFNEVVCDSVVSFSIRFQGPINGVPQSESICRGDNFLLGGIGLTEPGVYFDTVTSVVTSCDSIVELTLTVIEPVDLPDETIVLCPGESFSAFNGDVVENDGSLSESETGMQVFQSNAGCDTTQMVQFTRVRGTTTINNVTICQGDTFDFGGMSFTTAGTFSVTLPHPSFPTCDSLVDLNLTVIDDLMTDLGAEQRCEGDFFQIGDSIITTSGLFNITLPSNRLNSAGVGCDSIVSVNLNFQAPVLGEVQNEAICEGETFTFGGNSLTVAGSYFDTLMSRTTMCDSIVELTLSVILPVDLPDETIVLCPGESFTAFNGTVLTNDGSLSESETGIQVFQSNAGCDTTQMVQFTRVRGTTTINNVTICQGDTFDFGGMSFTTAGTFSVTLPHPSFPTCDSLVDLNLTVIDDLMTDLGDELKCEGETLQVGDSIITTTGEYIITLPTNRRTSEGIVCDSIVRVNFIIQPTTTTNLNETICDGQVFEVGDQTYTIAGTYTDTLMTSGTGCDSIVNLELAVIVPAITAVDTSICFGSTITIGGQVLDRTEFRQIVIFTAEGCDSIMFNVDLTVIDAINTVNSVEICPGETVTVGSSVYDSIGTFTDILMASTGCDSTIRTVITSKVIDETAFSRDICTGQTFRFGADDLDVSGTFRDTVQTSEGCDSILVLTLNVVEQIETSLDDIIICDGDSRMFGGSILTESGLYMDTLMTSAGCDSIVSLDLTVTPPLQVDTENIIGACDGISNGSFVISDIPGATGPYTITGVPGITEATTLPITVTDLLAQTYNFTVTDANGCQASSTATITNDRSNAISINSVEVDPAGIFNLFVTFDGQATSISWDNVPGLSCYDCPDPQATITEPTTFAVTVVDIEGCISIDSINLTVDGIGNIYTPSVFNPESDNGNDRFYIQGEDNVEAFYDLSIFDRWGNLVYSVIGAPINDREFGWNGRMGTKELNPGVFVYTTRIFKSNGIEKIMKGDITLIK